MRQTKLAIIERGAGAAVPTVRRTSEALAQQIPGTLIRINPREANVPAGHVSLALGATGGIRRICQGLEGRADISL